MVYVNCKAKLEQNYFLKQITTPKFLDLDIKDIYQFDVLEYKSNLPFNMFTVC